MFPASQFLGETLITVDVSRAFVLELVLTFFLMLVIINVSTGSKEIGVVAGIAIDAVVLLEAIVSGNLEHLWMYISAPIFGALLAVVSCKLIKDENCCTNEKC